MENLWGNIEKMDDDILFPKEILEEQSDILPNLTEGKLYGEVVDYTNDVWEELDEVKETEFCYRLFIRSRFMENYRFGVLTIFHNIDMYPVYIKADTSIHLELTNKKNGFLQANSEKEFKKTLASILQSEKVNVVIKSLLRLSK